MPASTASPSTLPVQPSAFPSPTLTQLTDVAAARRVPRRSPTAPVRVLSNTEFESASNLPSVAHSPAAAFTLPYLTLKRCFLSIVFSHFQTNLRVARTTREVCFNSAPFLCPAPILCPLEDAPLVLASFSRTRQLHLTFSTSCPQSTARWPFSTPPCCAQQFFESQVPSLSQFKTGFHEFSPSPIFLS